MKSAEAPPAHTRNIPVAIKKTENPLTKKNTLAIIGAINSEKGHVERNAAISSESCADTLLKKCVSVIASTNAAPIREETKMMSIVRMDVLEVIKDVAASAVPIMTKL